MASWFDFPMKPTLDFFSLVWYEQKLHSESKKDEILVKKPKPIFLLMLYFPPSSPIFFSPKMWTVPLSLLQASHCELISKAIE
jgi:hypothetical protein